MKDLDFLASKENVPIFSTTGMEEAVYVFLGVPLELTNLGRKGVSEGPNAIRKALYNLETYDYHLDLDVDDLPIYDAGNVIVPIDLIDALNRVEEAANAILTFDKIGVFFGGEHLITLPLVKAETRHLDDVGVIILDAHLDARDEYPVNSRFTHATVTRRIAELLGPEKILVIGVHGASREEVKWARNSGLKVIYADQLSKADTNLEESLNELKNRPLHLSVDIDVLDPSVAPGVSYPEPGGLSLQTLLHILKLIIRTGRVIAIDIVELCPQVDPTGITPYVAAKVLTHLLLNHWSVSYVQGR